MSRSGAVNSVPLYPTELPTRLCTSSLLPYSAHRSPTARTWPSCALIPSGSADRWRHRWLTGATWSPGFDRSSWVRNESRKTRLPTWTEWEFAAAAADEHVADARRDPLWRQTILAALGRAPGSPLPAVGLKPPNLYGIRDLHGLVWEWVEDFDTLFMPRGHAEHAHADMAMSPGDTAMSCGAAALSVTDPENR